MEDRKTRMLNTIYSRVAEEKRTIDRCDEIQMELKRLNDGLQSCLEIASNSIGNEQIKSRIETLAYENNVSFKTACARINSDIKVHNENIKKLKADAERISSNKRPKVV